jgi:hypothetical protein
MMARILLKNGEVYAGGGWAKADVAIAGTTIERVGEVPPTGRPTG